MRSAICVLPFAASLTVFSCLDISQPQDLQKISELVSGPREGIAYPFAQGAIRAAGESFGVFLTNVATAGSLENGRHMAQGTAPLGLVQEDVLKYAQGKYLSQFLKDPAQADKELLAIAAQLKFLLAAYQKDVYLLVNTNNVADVYNETTGEPAADGKITLNDLLRQNAALTINLGAVDSETYISAKTIADAQPFVTQPVYTTEVDTDGIDAVVAGTLAAAFLVAEPPSSVLAAIAADAPVQLIRVTMPAGRKQYLETGLIYASDYPFQSTNVDNTIIVNEMLASGPALTSAASVPVFLDYVFSHTGDFAAFDPHWSQVSKATTKAVMLASPQLADQRALHYVTGVAPVDPTLLAPNFCSAGALDVDHSMEVELSYLLSRNLNVDLIEKNTTGSWENSYWMAQGGATMALVQDDLFPYLSQYGDSDSALQAASALKVAPLHYDYVHLVVNRNAFAHWSLNDTLFTNGQAYTFAVKTVTGAGAPSTGRTVGATPYAPTATAVTGLTGTAGDGQVTLSWTPPQSASVNHIEIWYGAGPAQFPGTINPAGTVISNLTNGTAYPVEVRSIDGSAGVLSVAKLSLTPAATVATEVSNLTVTVNDGRVTLSWAVPQGASFDRPQISYGSGASADTLFTGAFPEATGTPVFPNGYLYHVKQLLTDPGGAPALRVNVGPKTSGTFISAMALIGSYSNVLGTIEMDYSFDDADTAIDKVAAGVYDAAFVTSGVPHIRLRSHDTYSLPATVKLLATEFNDANGDGNPGNDMPEPYQTGLLSGGGIAQVESYPYATSLLPFDMPAIRVRALLTASPAFDDRAIAIFVQSIFRKTYYMVYPADPSDLSFMPDPLWVPISIGSYAAASAPYNTYGENVTGAMEYFARNPFGWTKASAAFYLALFP